MTRNNSHPNHSHPDAFERSPVENTLANLDPGVSRRDFLGMSATSLILAGGLAGAAKPNRKNGIPHRTLGRTGESVSVIGLGGYHLGKQSDPEESIRILRAGLDEGINFLDNCWDYNGGGGGNFIGKAIREGFCQKNFFLTNNHGRHKTNLVTQ